MGEHQKFNLIDLEGASEVINNLIDKLSSGAGWLANREIPSKIATNTYIEEIQKSNYDPLTKAALISQAKKTIKEYCNQKNIVEIAVESLQKRRHIWKAGMVRYQYFQHSILRKQRVRRMCLHRHLTTVATV